MDSFELWFLGSLFPRSPAAARLGTFRCGQHPAQILDVPSPFFGYQIRGARPGGAVEHLNMGIGGIIPAQKLKMAA